MKSEALRDLVVRLLDDSKAKDIKVLDVRQLTDVTDYMIIASGTSSRHVPALVNRVVEDVKEEGIKPLGVEGKEAGEWVLIDLADVVVHVMLPGAREFYDLERLWEAMPDRKDDANP